MQTQEKIYGGNIRTTSTTIGESREWNPLSTNRNFRGWIDIKGLRRIRCVTFDVQWWKIMCPQLDLAIWKCIIIIIIKLSLVGFSVGPGKDHFHDNN